MELICLCCLAETNRSYNITTKCDFRAEECYDTTQPTAVIQLSELYSQLTQLPPPQQELSWTTNQPMSDEICITCVALLKDFYLFRQRALKAHEELQTKANIARIIDNLDLNNIEAACLQQPAEGCGQERSETADGMLPYSSARSTTGPFSCTVCKKTFKRRTLLLRHEEIHLSEKRYRCQYCDKHFLAKASCYNHELKMHRKQRTAVDDKKPAGKKLRSRSVRRRGHEPTAETRERTEDIVQLSQPKLFPCDLCPKHFTRKSSLNTHKLVLHAGVRQYSCQVCNRAFGKEDSLKTHLALHFGKTHRCKLCGKTFAKSSFLRKHLEEHELPESKRKHVCPVCGKGFATKGHLADHELIHTDKRPHKCNICAMSFRQKQQLKIHSYQHFGKPFRCAECNSEYGSKARFQAHVNKHHQSRQDPVCPGKTSSGLIDETVNITEPDFGDKIVNEEILNEICYQINSNPIILQNIEAGGVNLMCNDQIVFLADDTSNLLSSTGHSL